MPYLLHHAYGARGPTVHLGCDIPAPFDTGGQGATPTPRPWRLRGQALWSSVFLGLTLARLRVTVKGLCAGHVSPCPRRLWHVSGTLGPLGPCVCHPVHLCRSFDLGRTLARFGESVKP